MPPSKTKTSTPRRGGTPRKSTTEKKAASKRGSARKSKTAPKKANLLGHDHLDPSSDVPLQEQLKQLISTHAVRILDLFRAWDLNSDGKISKKEFKKAFVELGLDQPEHQAEIETLFASFDKDSNGSIDQKELAKMLHRTGGYTAPPASEAVQTNLTQKFALRQASKAGGMQALLGADAKLNPTSDVPLTEQLRELLKSHSTKFVDLVSALLACDDGIAPHLPMAASGATS